MQPLIIDNPELIRRIENRARERGVSVEDVLLEAIPDGTTSSLHLPDPEALATTYSLSPEVAEQLVRTAKLMEWTPETIAAEIAWQQTVRDNPETIGRLLPGWWEHIERITAWPEHIRATFKSEEEAPSYDEDGLPI